MGAIQPSGPIKLVFKHHGRHVAVRTDHITYETLEAWIRYERPDLEGAKLVTVHGVLVYCRMFHDSFLRSYGRDLRTLYANDYVHVSVESGTRFKQYLPKLQDVFCGDVCNVHHMNHLGCDPVLCRMDKAQLHRYISRELGWRVAFHVRRGNVRVQQQTGFVLGARCMLVMLQALPDTDTGRFLMADGDQQLAQEIMSWLKV